jgi:hypothetical protein
VAANKSCWRRDGYGRKCALILVEFGVKKAAPWDANPHGA